MMQALLLLAWAVVCGLLGQLLFPDSPALRVISVIVGAGIWLTWFAWDGRRKS